MGAGLQQSPYGGLESTFHGATATAPMHAVGVPATHVVGYRYRVRWENVVPAAAIALFVIAGIAAVSSIGHWGGAGQAAGDTPGTVPASAVPVGGTQAIETKAVATQLRAASARAALGDFAAARSMLDDLAAPQRALPQVRAARTTLARNGARYDALLGQLGSDLQQGNAASARRDLAQLRAIAPRSPELAARSRQLATAATLTTATPTPGRRLAPVAAHATARAGAAPSPQPAVVAGSAGTQPAPTHPGVTAASPAPPAATATTPAGGPPAPPTAAPPATGVGAGGGAIGAPPVGAAHTAQ